MNPRLMKYMASTRPTVRNRIGEQLCPGLGLTGDARDGLRAGQTVADGRADGATAQGEATAYQCARGLDRGYELGICCHCDSSVRGSGSEGASGLRLV